MAVLSDEEFLSRFRGQSTNPVALDIPAAQPQQVQTNTASSDADFLLKFRSSTLPRSQAALGTVNAPPASVDATANLSLTQQEGRRDLKGELIPIESGPEGIPISDYWRLGWQSTPEKQLEVLKRMYPDKPSRILQSGDVVLEITDSKTGKPKDVMINPVGMSPEDLIDLAVQTPEIAAGAAAFIASKGTGFARTVASMVASSLATAVTGGARKAASRTAEGVPIDLGDLAKEQTASGLFDLGAQAAMGTVGKATRLLSPFRREIKPGTLEFDLERGAEFFKKEFGEDIRRTPAELTGSKALSAVEAAESPQPGARNVLDRLKDERRDQIRKIQARAVGKVQSEEEIGESAIGTLRREVVEPIENALETARSTAEAKGHQRIVKLIDDSIGMPSGARISPTMAGERTLEQFESKLAQAQAKVDDAYAKVNALPGGSGDVLSGDAAARAAQEIRKELPKVKTTKEVVRYDQYGNPMTADMPTTEVLKSGVPDGLIKALDDLESLRGGKVSLQTLTNMKRAAYDEIAKTEAVPGVKERWFNKIASAYEQGISNGIEETGDPALKNALRNAKDTYKKELLPFDRPGVKELAKGEFDTSRLSPEQVVNRMFEGPKAIENFRMMKEVLGADNPAFKTMKRAWADSQLASVSDPVTGSIDAGALFSKLKTMEADRPELLQEIIGKNYRELMGTLKTQQAFKNLKSLDESEVKALLNLKDPTADDLRSLIGMQKARDKAYVNTFLKDIADGLPIGSDIKPTEFVKRLRNADTPTKDVELILSQLEQRNPEARRAIATAEMYRLLDAASLREASTAAKGLAGEPMNLSGKKLADEIGRMGTDQRKRVELLLGGESVHPEDIGAPPVIGKKTTTRGDVLDNLVKVLSREQQNVDVFGKLGSIGQGMTTRQALRSPWQYAKEYAKKGLLALAYTSEKGTKLVANRAFGPEESAAIANTLIGSEPFVTRAIEAFGPEMARSMISDLKDSIDRYVHEINRDTPETRKRKELQKLMQGQSADVRIE